MLKQVSRLQEASQRLLMPSAILQGAIHCVILTLVPSSEAGV